MGKFEDLHRRARALSLLGVMLGFGMLIAAPVARASSHGIGPTSDPEAARYCLNSAGLNGQPQVVQGVRVVAVCVDNYQYVPGDDNVMPCVGYVDGTPASTCRSGPAVAAPALQVRRGIPLLFVVPDPNMHTLTSTACPNVFA